LIESLDQYSCSDGVASDSLAANRWVDGSLVDAVALFLWRCVYFSQLEGGSVDVFVSTGIKAAQTQTAVHAIILRASRPNVQNGVTSLGVVCETKNGVSK